MAVQKTSDEQCSFHQASRLPPEWNGLCDRFCPAFVELTPQQALDNCPTTLYTERSELFVGQLSPEESKMP
jgi:hypothetical protein